MPRANESIWTPQCEISYTNDLTGADRTGTITREAYQKLRAAGKLGQVTNYLQNLRNRGYEFSGAMGKSGKFHDQGVRRILGHADKLLAQLKELEKGAEMEGSVGTAEVEGMTQPSLPVLPEPPAHHPMVLASEEEKAQS